MDQTYKNRKVHIIMAVKKKITPLFSWDPKKTQSELAEALKTLSKRYPILSTKKADTKIVFVQEGNPAECSVKKEKNVITVSYCKVNMALRMTGTILSGIIPEKADYCPFEMFGVMIDCSRNAVMTVDYLKSYLDRLAILGYNMAMLYTEETYQIKEEPLFGAMRGAYTPAEIREIDDYAASLGIEIIPCIQTLAHLEQMFRWNRFDEINDIYGILLVDEPKTYELVEKMIVTWKNNVRSRRIHLGMDEAHGVGDGKFKKRFGEESRFNIINRHLKKVVDLCNKHGLKPMMWSDMYFRIGSKDSNYYDVNTVIPQEVADDIPKEVELVYWDYYHEDKNFYSDWIARHRALGGEPLMGSGVWTWSKFWYDHFYTTETVIPCIEACREAKVKDVFFTMWGDDGAYCDFDSAFAGLAFASELAFTGAAKDKIIDKKFNALFDGASYSDNLILADGVRGYSHLLPGILYDDPLMLIYEGGLMAKKDKSYAYTAKYDWKSIMKDLAAAKKKIAKAKDQGCAGSIAYEKAFIDMMDAKVRYADELLKAYRKKNNIKAVGEVIPILKEFKSKLKKFSAEFRAMWFRHNKPFGIESVQIRMAGLLARTDEALIRLQEFADGKAANIPELEDLFKIREDIRLPWGHYGKVAYGTVIH